MAKNRPVDVGSKTATNAVPVSPKRVVECLDSARFWVRELPRYADKEQFRADWLAISSAIVSAVTGLSIWPVLENGSDLGKVVFSLGAVTAAMLTSVPKIKHYAEMAGQARELTSRYGSVLGALADLGEAPNFDQAAAQAVVSEFEATKAKKDALQRLPDRQKLEIERAADLQRLRIRAGVSSPAGLQTPAN